MCDGRACRRFLFLLRSISLAEHRLRRRHRGSTRNTGAIRGNRPNALIESSDNSSRGPEAKLFHVEFPITMSRKYTL